MTPRGKALLAGVLVFGTATAGLVVVTTRPFSRRCDKVIESPSLLLDLRDASHFQYLTRQNIAVKYPRDYGPPSSSDSRVVNRWQLRAGNPGGALFADFTTDQRGTATISASPLAGSGPTLSVTIPVVCHVR